MIFNYEDIDPSRNYQAQIGVHLDMALKLGMLTQDHAMAIFTEWVVWEPVETSMADEAIEILRNEEDGFTD